MKLIIAGSRIFTDKQVILDALEGSKIPWSEVDEEVCGQARGIDLLGRDVAYEAGIPIKYFPALWHKHGRRAGYIRNVEMAEYADALLAIWDGKSKGTLHMIEVMSRLGKPVYIFQPPVET